MAKKTLKDLDVKGKKVLVRVDFNVPIKDGVITNDNRITAALPTLKYILENGGKVIAFSHLGKVKEEADKASKTLAPVAKRLEELLGKPVKFVPETRGAALEKAVAELKDGEILMFENTRFEDLDGKKESKNDPELGKYWASLGDVFVNDAFGTAHRAHASNVGIASNIKAKTLVSTHYHELTSLESRFDNIKNYCMLVDDATEIKFLKKIVEGKADKSYGIHVAMLADIPYEVLERANVILSRLETKEKKSVSNYKKNSMQEQVSLEDFSKENNLRIVQKIKDINLDEYSAREALELLYEIKESLR